jgi:hypothetical protein
VLQLELSDADRAWCVILVRWGKGNEDREVPLGERALAWITPTSAPIGKTCQHAIESRIAHTVIAQAIPNMSIHRASTLAAGCR